MRILMLLLLPILAFASPSKKPYEQWFTGPLLTPMAITPEREHPSIEVTVGVKEQYGFYNSSWNIKNTPDLWGFFNYYDAQLGISSILGMEIIGSWVSNFSKGANNTGIQDTIVRVGFQICNEVPNTWIPDFRILFQEIFPTGNYNKLNPSKNLTDLTGEGSFQSGLFLAFQKLFDPSNGHKYQMRLSGGYFIPAPTQVSGLNVFGGSPTTAGTAYPGNYISVYCSGEYNFNYCWAIGFDSNFQYHFKGRFSGDPGTQLAPIPLESVQFTFAPELQHTFTPSTGMILGAWFSVLGKNTPAFASVFFSLLHIF